MFKLQHENCIYVASLGFVGDLNTFIRRNDEVHLHVK